MLSVVSVHAKLHTQPAGVLWGAGGGGRKLLVYVRSVVAAIFDFKREEDWGE